MASVHGRGGYAGGQDEEAAEPWDDTQFGPWTGARQPKASGPGARKSISLTTEILLHAHTGHPSICLLAFLREPRNRLEADHTKEDGARIETLTIRQGGGAGGRNECYRKWPQACEACVTSSQTSVPAGVRVPDATLPSLRNRRAGATTAFPRSFGWSNALPVNSRLRSLHQRFAVRWFAHCSRVNRVAQAWIVHTHSAREFVAGAVPKVTRDDAMRSREGPEEWKLAQGSACTAPPLSHTVI